MAGNYRNRSIDGGGFRCWQNDHMYKSSYAHFHSKDSVEGKNKAIPGYAGYIPYVKPESLYGKGYTPITKQCLSSDKLGKNILGLSTNGFNINQQALIDKSKMASSSKYGKTGIQKAQPAWNEGVWRSTTHDFFNDPNKMSNPLHRDSDKFSETVKQGTRSSGFATNHAYLDGRGWKPEKVLRGDNHRSEYRDRFNKEKEFHRDTVVKKERKLRGKEWNYKYN